MAYAKRSQDCMYVAQLDPVYEVKYLKSNISELL
jgi:hypothetical protein